MKSTGKSCMYLGFLLGTIVLFCLEVRADTTMSPVTTAGSPSVPTVQNPASQNPTDTSIAPTTPASQETTTSTTQTTTIRATPLTSPFPETSAPPALASALPTEGPTSSYTVAGKDQELVTLGKAQTEAELCEENSKRLVLICLIVIGALVFLCVCLLLATVVMATKLSYFKRRQPSKRLPRSNGDFLSANSLWPAGLETLQRMAVETSETDSVTQRSGSKRMAAGQGKTAEEASKKLASEISDRQKHKETSAKETPVP
ncbi:protein EVI2A [Elgaria multicarinata webbii]|uniref:protein EVI2A n=1 Tax=Elgaria multicarinata webbii TaxID=159646 RepID=UPI002FCCBD3F